MYSLSETKPKLREDMISRDQYLDLLEGQFEEERVLCLTGIEGVGVTSTLALFARRHGENCASYFNNGWSRHLLNARTIVSSLLKQLSFYTKENLNSGEDETTLSNSIYKLSKQTKNKSIKYLYFVLDGFYSIPPEYVDSIKQLLAPLFSLENGRFLFSGDRDDIKQLLPEGIPVKQSNEILRFQKNDVEGYLERVKPGLSQDMKDAIYDLSGKGLARNLIILTEKLKKDGEEKINIYYRNEVEDFYEEDYNWIEDQKDENLTMMMALLTYSELPQNRQSVMRTLNLNEKATSDLIEQCKDYIEEKENLISLKSDDFRKYLRVRLSHLKTNIELLLIDMIEKWGKAEDQFLYLPALYKHVKDNKQLVAYLTSDNVQHYLEDKMSQAALNEQCEYGFNACNDFETQAAAYFRFAINRSVSREIEKNELSDSEIEALIATGDDEQAFNLTQNVFLLEERLKCLLIIAQAGKHLSDAMSEEIDTQIMTLADTIDFEHIPDKALELAKLMLPVKLEKALEIIDKVAKVSKNRQQIDRLYTAISLSYNYEGKIDNANSAKTDIVCTKISDEGLRKMATVMKSIMKDSTAEQVVAKMKELPTASSQLYFLSFWIPDHKEREDICFAVEYAVRLTIDTSTNSMPKVSFLRQFCKPLAKMDQGQVKTVIGLLDAVVTNIKYPTVEYVKLQILIISAVTKFDKDDAKNRLEDLYLEITELNDKALQAHCKALLLRDYELLGKKKDVEEWMMPAFKLQDDITNDVTVILENSAYHLKVVEGPIKALVCSAPSFINDVINKMNTEERKARAFLLAATEYVKQADVINLDWKYFVKLFQGSTYDRTELYKPLIELVQKITEVTEKDTILYDSVKKYYDLFKEIEQADAQCYVFATLYVWISQYFEDEDFKLVVKGDLNAMWNKINIPWLKVNTGYEIAKVLSKISMKSEAREYVAKTAKIRTNQLLSSYSCIAAYTESMNLYVHSLGILIRSGLCTDEDLDQIKTLMAYDESNGECMILWARIALEYYGVNDIERFNNILNRYVSKPINQYSKFYQKRILYHISPALFLCSKTLLYDRLKDYDPFFQNACIENIAHYILTKYPYPEYTYSREIQAQISMEKKDYDLLLDLMAHTTDENFIFNYTDIIAQAIKRDSSRTLSREIQNVLWNNLYKIVNEHLPTKGGIQHNGYRIACKAMIDGRRNSGITNSKVLKEEIESVPNMADQAFLYAHVAGYLKKVSEKAEFIDLAVQKTEGIGYTFDKFNRYGICLQESFIAANIKAKDIAQKVMVALKSDGNGSYGDYQRMIDLVRDHDVELAENMLEMVDDDPVRLHYRKRLKDRMTSNKKIEAARNDFGQVTRLTNDEQMRFFERQMEFLIKRKNVIRDVNSTKSILKKVYENSITDMKNAVLFFMENLFEKNQVNRKYRTLLREMHCAIIYNLKLVLAIASGTKVKLERVNRIMNERSDSNDSMIQVGEGDKGVKTLLSWYKEHPCDIIRIIDPYFHAEDLFIIKALMDINNDLKCSILTNNDRQDGLNEVFQNGWNAISAELTGRIEVKSCCYESNRKAPFHDRWWLLYDSNEDLYYGKRLASASTFGSRISEISDMGEKAIASAMKVWERFFHNMVPKYEEQKIKYEETKLR